MVWWSLWVEVNLWAGYFFLSFAYFCITNGYLIVIGEGWDPINQFNPVTFSCLSQARTWIYIICLSLFHVQWFEVKVNVCFVDIGVIVNYNCLICYFMITFKLTWPIEPISLIVICSQASVISETLDQIEGDLNDNLMVLYAIHDVHPN